MRKSIYHRLTSLHIPISLKLGLAISVLLMVSMGSISLYIISHQSDLLRQQTREMGTTLVQQIAESSAEPLLLEDRLGLATLLKNLTASPYLLGAAVYDKEGQLIESTGRVPDKLLMAEKGAVLDTEGSVWSFAWGSGAGVWPENNVISFVKPIDFKDVAVGFALITYSHFNMRVMTSESTQSLVMVTVIFLLLGLVASLILGRRISRPMHELVAASRQISNGNYGYRIDKSRIDEMGILIDSFNAMAEGLEHKMRVERVFSQFVSPRVANHILGNLDQVNLGGTKIEATVLFADMIGFTEVSEKLTPEGVSHLLNDYFSHITEISSQFGGFIDKFIGDCAMVVFGAPEPDPDHSYHAIVCAVAIQKMIAALNRQRVAAGGFPVYFKIGINSGDMLAGNMGSEERLQYTVVGDAVNLAARLMFKAAANEIIISEELYCSPSVTGRISATPKRAYSLKGKLNPVQGYAVDNLRPDQMRIIDAIIRDQLLRHEIS